MPTRRNNWYDLHSTRRYPLDDKATGTGDDGERLPYDIIADLHLRFPSTAGRWAFLAGLTITDNLVTMVFLGADSVTQEADFVPLASVNILQSQVEESIHVPVSPLYPGVGGFVVLGDTSENFVGRFSQPSQGLLAARAARAYTKLPIPTIRKLGRATGLAGLVTLRAGTDLQIVKETRDVLDHGEVDALVIRLLQTPGAPNVLERYIGPCDGRPESRNCNRNGIQTINEARPDCAGNIEICFRQIEDYPYSSCGGAVIDHPVGIEQVCLAQEPERFKGRDQCLPSLSSSSLSLSEFLASSSSSSSSSAGSVAPPPAGATLPYCENFDDGVADFFEVKVGTFEFVDDDSPEEQCPGLRSLSSLSYSSCSLSSSEPDALCGYFVPYTEPVLKSYRANNTGQRNVSVWDANAFASSLDKRIITDLKMNSSGFRTNAGVIVNYHEVDPLTNPHIEYLQPLLSRVFNELQLWWFTGLAIVKIAAVGLGSPVKIGHWYRMQVDVIDLAGTPVIDTTVTGVTNPGWPQAKLTVPVSTEFGADDGAFGLGSIRSRCRWSYFSVEEI